MNRTCWALGALAAWALLLETPADASLNVVVDFGSAPGKIGVGAELPFSQPFLFGDPTTVSDEPDAIRYESSGSPTPFLASYVVGFAAPPDVSAVDPDLDRFVVDLTINAANDYDTLVLTMDSARFVDDRQEIDASSSFEFDLSGLAPGTHRLVGGTLAGSPNPNLRVPTLDPESDSFDAFVLFAFDPRMIFDPVLDVSIEQIAFLRIPEPNGFALAVLGLIAARRQRGSCA